jgi:peptidoglycan/LPS O-acetylase OafA/YrhL
MLLVAALVPVVIVPLQPEHLVAGTLLVQTWVPGVLEPYGGNGVSWSLSCEAAFYLALPVVLPLLLRLPPAWRWVVAGTWWAAASAVTLLVAHGGYGLGDAVYVFPPLRFGEFLLGVAAALEVKRGWRLSGRGAAGLAAAGIALAVLGRGAFPGAGPGSALAVLALVVWAAQRDLAGVPGMLTRPWLVYAGQLSFAFYLVHELVLLNVSAATGLSGWVADVALVPAALLAAVLLHHVVELPCERRLRPGRLAVTSSAETVRPAPPRG